MIPKVVGAGVDSYLRILHKKFPDGLEVISQPTYGRFIFTRHDAEIGHCEFGPHR